MASGNRHEELGRMGRVRGTWNAYSRGLSYDMFTKFEHLYPLNNKLQGGPSASGKKYVDIKFRVPLLAWVTG